MKFTIDGYIYLLTLLKEKEYKITNYSNWERYDKCVILRHDVDFDMTKALLIAQTEYDYGVESVFFVLLTSNFYNIHSSVNKRMIKQIQKMGHTIGLHFDEMAYPEDAGNADRIMDRIKKEIDILSEALETDVMVYSYHRPTKTILDSNIRISGVINSYERLFFKEFKYLSDSRMHWREPVLDIISQGNFSRMQILTHPFWYRDKEKSMKAILCEFLNMAGMQRYDDLNDNFTGLDKIFDRGGYEIMMVAIHQPHYFPWLGYLAKMASVDKFIFMDNVQLEKRSYMIRNRIIDPDGQIRYLNISCEKHNHYEKAYREIKEKDFESWTNRQKGTIIRAYKKCDYFDEIWKVITPVFDREYIFLCDVTLQSVKILREVFEIDTPFVLQSDLHIDSNLRKEKLILGICKAVGADVYYAGRGASMKYLDNDECEEEGIRLVYQDYRHPVYKQIGDHLFAPGLSALDLLFNEGIRGAREIFWNSLQQ